MTNVKRTIKRKEEFKFKTRNGKMEVFREGDTLIPIDSPAYPVTIVKINRKDEKIQWRYQDQKNPDDLIDSNFKLFRNYLASTDVKVKRDD